MEPRRPDHRANLKAALRQSMLLTPVDELHEHRLLRRIKSVLLAGLIIFKLMTEPAVLILTTPSALLYKVAALGRYPDEFAVALILAAGVLVVYILQQIMAPQWLHRRMVAKATVYALVASSVAWFYLMAASFRMEAGALHMLLFLNSACCMGFALALGLGLNSELSRAMGGCEC